MLLHPSSRPLLRMAEGIRRWLIGWRPFSRSFPTIFSSFRCHTMLYFVYLLRRFWAAQDTFRPNQWLIDLPTCMDGRSIAYLATDQQRGAMEGTDTVLASLWRVGCTWNKETEFFCNNEKGEKLVPYHQPSTRSDQQDLQPQQSTRNHWCHFQVYVEGGLMRRFGIMGRRHCGVLAARLTSMVSEMFFLFKLPRYV